MDDQTPIDLAHAAMRDAPEDDALRLRFFERLGDAELFMLLEDEAEGATITPQTFDIGPQTIVLLFDREERLTQFVGAAAPYAAVSGRVVADMLAGQNLGFGLNLDVAPSSFLLDPDGVTWLAEVLSHAPDEITQSLDEIAPPTGLPETLLTALDEKLATGAGLAQFAFLVATIAEGGGRGHMLAFIDVIPGAETALSQAVAEVLTFSNLDAGVLDVGFFASGDAMADKLAQVGLRFDLPTPDPIVSQSVTAPGMDPDKPPRLK